MIAEAIDAATAVGLALLTWIVLAAAVLTAALFAVVAAGWVVWRVLSGAWRRGRPRKPVTAPLAAEQPAGDPEPLCAAERNPATPHRTPPTRARTDTEEAA